MPRWFCGCKSISLRQISLHRCLAEYSMYIIHFGRKSYLFVLLNQTDIIPSHIRENYWHEIDLLWHVKCLVIVDLYINIFFTLRGKLYLFILLGQTVIPSYIRVNYWHEIDWLTVTCEMYAICWFTCTVKTLYKSKFFTTSVVFAQMYQFSLNLIEFITTEIQFNVKSFSVNTVVVERADCIFFTLPEKIISFHLLGQTVIPSYKRVNYC